MRRISAVVVALSLILVSIEPARAGGTLWGLSSSTPGTLYTIDTATGAATAVVDVTGDQRTSFVGLEYLNGTMYATDVLTGSGFRFGSIDLTTGAFAAINDQGGSINWHGLAANPGANLLYSVDVDPGAAGFPLVSITPAGAVTTIGPTQQNIRGLAYDAGHGLLYGVDRDELFTIDTTTGAATLIGGLGLVNDRPGLAFDEGSGVLYLNTGVIGGAFDNMLFTVNTLTGLATVVGPNGAVAGDGIDGLAFVPAGEVVPAPGAVVLGCLGATLVGWLRRRRAL